MNVGVLVGEDDEKEDDEFWINGFEVGDRVALASDFVNVGVSVEVTGVGASDETGIAGSVLEIDGEFGVSADWLEESHEEEEDGYDIE